MAIPPEYIDLSAKEILEKYGYKVDLINPNVAYIFDKSGKYLGEYSVISALKELNDYGEIRK